jgi:hypothetical protein
MFNQKQREINDLRGSVEFWQNEWNRVEDVISEAVEIFGITPAKGNVADFEDYLSQFRKTKAERVERAKIEEIIKSLVKQDSLKRGV